MSTFMPLAFVTFSSTGLDPRVHDLTELAAARVCPTERGSFVARIRPGKPREGRFGVIDLALDDALDVARELLRGCVLVAFDAASTRAMLDGTCDRLGVARIEFDPRMLDVRSLVWPRVPAARTLLDARIAFGFSPAPNPQHDELHALLSVYRAVVGVAS